MPIVPPLPPPHNPPPPTAEPRRRLVRRSMPTGLLSPSVVELPPPPPRPSDVVDANVVIHFFNDPQGNLHRAVYVAVLDLEGETVKWKKSKIRDNTGHTIFEWLERGNAGSLHVGWGLPGSKLFLQAQAFPEAPPGLTGTTGRALFSFDLSPSTIPFLTLEQRRQILALQNRLRGQAALASTGSQASASAGT